MNVNDYCLGCMTPEIGCATHDELPEPSAPKLDTVYATDEAYLAQVAAYVKYAESQMKRKDGPCESHAYRTGLAMGLFGVLGDSLRFRLKWDAERKLRANIHLIERRGG